MDVWRKGIGQVLAKLKRNANYVYFAEPVDPVKLNIPLYPFLVRTPMDLGTVEKKLADGVYQTRHEAATDMALVFEASLIFNGPPSVASPVFIAAKSTRDCFISAFRAKFGEDPPKSPQVVQCAHPEFRKEGLEVLQMTHSIEKVFEDMIRKLTKKFESHISPFLYPVDPVHTQGYYDKVKHPMSLSIVETKLFLHQYPTAEHMANDVRQIWENCRIYNGESKLARTASKLGDKFEKYYLKTRSDIAKGKLSKVSKKKRVREDGSSSPIINIVDRPPSSVPKAVQQPVPAKPVSPVSPAVPETAQQNSVPSLPLHQHIRAVMSKLCESEVGQQFEKASCEQSVTIEHCRKQADSAGYSEFNGFVSDMAAVIAEFRKSHIGGPPETVELASRVEALFKRLVESEGGLERPLKRRRKSSVTLAVPPEISRTAVSFSKSGCQVILNHLFDDPMSELFRHPVGTSVPGYLDVIKRPMDLSTVKSKLSKGKYSSNGAFASDVRLIWQNCRDFNGNDPITDVANRLAEKFEKMLARIDAFTEQPSPARQTPKAKKASSSAGSVLSKDPSADMNEASQKKCEEILRRIRKVELSSDFAVPVDPVMYNYQGYDDVIKKRMDLLTLQNALQSKRYLTPSAFASDLFLVFENALTYQATPRPTQVAARFLLNESRLLFSEAFPGLSAIPKDWNSMARKSLSIISEYDHGNLFAEPVNPLTFNILTYYEVVSTPMDLSSIKRKLNANLYPTVDAFLEDINRTWQNCIDFHSGGDNQMLADVARECREHFKSEWDRLQKVASRKGKPKDADSKPKVSKERTQKKPAPLGCLQVIRRLKKMDTLKAFCSPVNLEQYPTYSSIVSEPIDLGTIESKLLKGQLSSADEVTRLLRLVFENCRLYNIEGSPMRILGDQLCNWMEPALRSSIAEGRLKASYDEIMAKVAERRSAQAHKEQEKEQKKQAKLAEKAERREAKEKERQQKQELREQKQKEKAKIQEAKFAAKQMLPPRTPTNGHPSGQGRPQVSGRPRPTALPRLQKPSAPLEEKDIVKTNPPRPPLTFTQRRFVLDFTRQMTSAVEAIGATGGNSLRKRSNDLEKSVKGTAGRKDMNMTDSLVGPQNTRQSGHLGPSSSSTLQFSWKTSASGRRGSKKKPITATGSVPRLFSQQDSDVADMKVDSSAEACSWNRKVSLWMKQQCTEDVHGEKQPGLSPSLSNLHRHGDTVVLYQAHLQHSCLQQQSLEELGFCRHSRRPDLWLRCGRHCVQPSDPSFTANSVSLDVYRVVLLSRTDTVVPLRIKVGPLSGEQWQLMASLKSLVLKAGTLMSCDDQTSVFFHPHPFSLRQVQNTTTQLGLPSSLDSEWVDHGFYLAQSSLSSKEPFVSFHVIGYHNSISISVDGVDCVDFLEYPLSAQAIAGQTTSITTTPSIMHSSSLVSVETK